MDLDEHQRDEHPSLWMGDGVGRQPALTCPSVTPREEPLTTGDQGTDVEGDASTITHTRQHERNHPLAEVVTALPGTTMEGSQWFRPEPLRGELPAMCSLWASAPAS